MLLIGRQNQIKFKVNVHGTQVEPSVQVVFGKDPEYSFTAKRNGDEWVAIADLPEGMEPGEYDFRVDVVVKYRLFSPIKQKVQLGQPANEPLETPPKTPEVNPVPIDPPVVEPALEKTWEDDGGETPSKAPSIKQPEVEFLNLLRDTANKTDEPVTIKETKKPAKKKSYSVKTEMPVPSLKKSQPTRFKLADIAADASNKFDVPLKESETYKRPDTSNRTVSINQKTPVKLIKGKVVFL